MLPIPTIVERPLEAAVHNAALRGGFTPLQARILAGRLTAREADNLQQIVFPALSDLDLPDQLPDIDVAVERIVAAITGGEHLLLVSDFDCDGSTANCVLRCALIDFLGVPPERVHTFIGLRKTGYGVTHPLVQRILAEAPRPSLIITADQGSSNEETIRVLHAAGIDVVVSDHHGVGIDGPPASAVACVNPVREGSTFDPLVCGCYVAFLLMAAVRARLVAIGHLPASTPKLTALLDFAGVATTADCVSMGRSKNNRAIVKYALNLMNRPDARPAWAAARRLFKIDGPITNQDLAFRLAPLINSKSRMGDAVEGVQFLLSADDAEADKLIQVLHADNLGRRDIEHKMQLEAMVLAETFVEAGRSAVVIYLEEGVGSIHGIVASRLVEATGRPTVMFAPKHDVEGVLTGSARSIPEVHVREVFEEIHLANPGMFLSWGGHAGAGGLSLRLVDLDRFIDAFEAATRARLSGVLPMPKVRTDGVLPAGADLRTLAEIQVIGPYGREYEVPCFELDGKVLSVRAVGTPRVHLQVAVRADDGSTYSAVWFRALVDESDPLPLEAGQRCQLAVELDANTFRGKTNLQLIVRASVPVPVSPRPERLNAGSFAATPA